MFSGLIFNAEYDTVDQFFLIDPFCDKSAEMDLKMNYYINFADFRYDFKLRIFIESVFNRISYNGTLSVDEIR